MLFCSEYLSFSALAAKACSSEHQVFLFKGANSHGQLCNGNQDDILEPRQVQVPYPSIKYIKGGGGHTAVVTDDDDLYTAGWNNKGQLGLNSDDAEILKLTRVSSVTKVQSVSCGWNHTLIVCNNGQLYGCGSNQYGQIGVGDHLNETKQFCLISIPNEKATVCAAGLRHSLIITDFGRVWAFGANKSGQLGLGKTDRKFVPVPEVVSSLNNKNITRVASGSQHSVALSDSGEVFCWGSNQYGQCGVDPSKMENKLFASPLQIGGMLKKVKVSEVVSGWSHILVKTDGGEVMSWGRADYGQLGLGDDVVSQGYCYVPQKIPHFKRPLQVPLTEPPCN